MATPRGRHVNPFELETQEKPRAVREIKKIDKLEMLFFDCDNTLVMTEGMAFRQTAGLVNELMKKYGIEEQYTGEKLLVDYIGLTFKEMLPELAEKHGFELTAEVTKEMIAREEEEVIKVIKKEAVPCPGILPVLQRVHAEKIYRKAVVSSSSFNRVSATLSATELHDFFSFDRIFSAKSSLPKPVGKPEPDIYKHAMKVMKVKPEECLAFEDSRTGMQAAHSAGIPCVGYVGCYSSKAKQDQLELDFNDMGAVATIYHWDEFRGLMKKITSVE